MNLFSPLSLQEFNSQYLGQKPFAAAGTGASFRKMLSWELLAELFSSSYADCWLVNQGRLNPQHYKENFRLNFAEAVNGFIAGHTVLVRHSERAHRDLGVIASDFYKVFQVPIDIQLYATPQGQEGFDWHYDCEDVFVIQSSGQKEFTLRKNTDLVLSHRHCLPQSLEDFQKRSAGPEIKCLLAAGDFLYIPRGYWHKARAITDSFHFSVGLFYQDHLFGAKLHC